jgi:hypothetical protein
MADSDVLTGEEAHKLAEALNKTKSTGVTFSARSFIGMSTIALSYILGTTGTHNDELENWILKAIGRKVE